jgi:hypothetical protein
VIHPKAPDDTETDITMAAKLQEILLAPGTQPRVVAGCCAMIEQEVSAKSGISGTARSTWPTRP